MILQTLLGGDEMKRIFLVAMVMTFVVGNYASAEEGVAITIYNKDLALVKDSRKLEIKPGIGDLKFTDVASRIDPTSVSLKSITHPKNLSILEQNYEYDLVSADKLLQKYIDKTVQVLTSQGKVQKGVLMSFDSNQLVLNTDEGITMIRRGDNITDIQFGDSDTKLITRPTLLWKTLSDKPGEHLATVSYMTGGISWRSNYIVIANDDDTEMDFTGWVTITNNSGATYENAKLKLIAGDIHRAPKPEFNRRRAVDGLKAPMMMAKRSGFQEKSFFEYHLYTLGRKSTIKDKQIKQVELLSASDASMEKVFIYDPVGSSFHGYWYAGRYGQSKNTKVQVMFEIKNEEENNMGMPLPKGTVRVFKRDSDGSLEFLGEDNIDHTPKNETLRLKIGNAFDIVAERRATNFKKITDRSARETFEIKIRNHKDTDVIVDVIERMNRAEDWRIETSTHEWKKENSRTMKIPVSVKANGEATFTYTVFYRW